MDQDALRERFSGWRNQHLRTAWKPRLRDGGSAIASHFGGSPTLGAGDEWPTCESCSQPLQFFLQLELSTLPATSTPRGKGLLQLFYCSRDTGDCETWSAFSGTHLVRLLDVPGVTVAHPPALSAFPVRFLDGWDEFTDSPDPAEHEELGLAFDYDFKESCVTVRCPELGIEVKDLSFDMDPAETISSAAPGDKLRGWPHWVQGVEYPPCPKCERRMGLLMQIDSEDSLPYMFGDGGCGHITQCAEHPEVLAFGWACG